MPAGGARVGAGRPANPDALRRERKTDHVTWTHLPSAGREGPPPAWPLTRPTKRELELWAEEWQRPQAIRWEEMGVAREVALYVRAMRLGESAKASSADRKLVAQYMNDLGISIRGQASLRWVIDPPVAEGPPAPDATVVADEDDKARFLRVVADNAS